MEPIFCDDWDQPSYMSHMSVEFNLNEGAVYVYQARPPFVDGCTPDQWHGIEFDIQVDALNRYSYAGRTHVIPERVEKFLLSAVGQELIERIFADSDVVWNGHNYVGKLGEDASEALAELTYELQGLPYGKWENWDADQILSDVLYEIRNLESPEEARLYGEKIQEEFLDGFALPDVDLAYACENIWMEADDDSETGD